jgi:toxin YoeB
MTSGARLLVFDRGFLDDLDHWVRTGKKVALKILDLVGAFSCDPFDGIGKPEPLKSLGSGVWSRRITQEQRLVFRVADDRVTFAQARHHY